MQMYVWSEINSISCHLFASINVCQDYKLEKRTYIRPLRCQYIRNDNRDYGFLTCNVREYENLRKSDNIHSAQQVIHTTIWQPAYDKCLLSISYLVREHTARNEKKLLQKIFNIVFENHNKFGKQTYRLKSSY